MHTSERSDGGAKSHSIDLMRLAAVASVAFVAAVAFTSAPGCTALLLLLLLLSPPPPRQGLGVFVVSLTLISPAFCCVPRALILPPSTLTVEGTSFADLSGEQAGGAGKTEEGWRARMRGERAAVRIRRTHSPCGILPAIAALAAAR